MGMCAEKCAKDYNISRQDQDEYAMESYRRAQAAIQNGSFAPEIVPVEIPVAANKGRGTLSTMVDTDEEPNAVNMDKLPQLKPVFDRGEHGTVTAANASSLNDGAAALVLMTEHDAQAHGLVPLARIRGFGDAEQDPVDFTTTPSMAVPVALQQAGVQASDIEYHEINEAFSVVALYVVLFLNTHSTPLFLFGALVV
jgi:acetyl-CoA C-acetyltransferase